MHWMNASVKGTSENWVFKLDRQRHEKSVEKNWEPMRLGVAKWKDTMCNSERCLSTKILVPSSHPVYSPWWPSPGNHNVEKEETRKKRNTHLTKFEAVRLDNMNMSEFENKQLTLLIDGLRKQYSVILSTVPWAEQ